VDGLLVRGPNGSGQAILIVAIVPAGVAQALDGSLRVDGQLISSFDVRALGVGDGDAARIKFTYLNDNFDAPTITYFDRKTRTQKPVIASLIIIDPVARTITLVFGPGSTPRLKDLNGTVFTISVPFAVQSNGLDPTLVQTQNSTSQASASSAQGLSEGTTSGSNLLVGANTSRTSPTGSGGGAVPENETLSGGGGSESSPLRELPQGPAALLALPSVTVSPSTLEPPSTPLDAPPTVRLPAPGADEEQDEPEQTREPSEEIQTGALDALFENLAGGDGAAEVEASWVALAGATFVGAAARRERRRSSNDRVTG
jgi:hypothetical protein